MVFDVIVSWPRNCDYPLWRQFIRDNRARFNEIIIAFTETNQGADYRNFVMDAMVGDYVHFIQPRELQPGEDWRNVAVNAALLHSYNAPWLWFTEQDFIIDNPRDFFGTVEMLQSEGAEVIGSYEGAQRLHPCNLFIKREILNRTSRNFAANPPVYDHFGALQMELGNLNITPAPMRETCGYHHLAGLSHNMTLLARGEQPNYKPEIFRDYLNKCLNVTVPISDRFRDLVAGSSSITA